MTLKIQAKERLGIDAAVAVNISLRVWQALATVFTLYSIARYLNVTEQGFYYVIQSLVGWQIVAELGLGFVLMQTASHERQHLHWSKGQNLTGDPDAIDRIGGLLRAALRWYLLVASGLWILLVSIGWAILRSQANAGVLAQDLLPLWVGIVSAVAVSLLIVPVSSIIEGLGQVATVGVQRLVQDVAGFTTLWVGLLFDQGLGSLLWFYVARTFAAMVFLILVWHRILVDLMRRPHPIAPIEWRKKVWPFQWRVALSSVSGLILFYLLNPLAFRSYGPVLGGQLGMTQNILNGVQTIALTWSTTKSSLFGLLVSRGQFDIIDRVYTKSMRIGVALSVAGCATLAFGIVVGRMFDIPFVDRLLSPGSVVLLSVPVIVNQISFTQTLYLRAHLKDPFLVPSMIGAVMTGSVLWTVSSRLGFDNYLRIFSLLALPGLLVSTVIFRVKRHEYRAAAYVHSPT
jgi:hypothetical protein